MFEKKRISENILILKKNLENQNNWDDFEQTNKDLKKLNYLSNFLNSVDEIESSYEDTIELLKITDENTNADMYLELEIELKAIERNANTLHIETLMSGKADSKNVLLEIHSGAGGVEAQDWVEMLLRMYSRWAESKNFKLQIIDQNVGDEAGLKSVTLKIDGEKAYGWLKLENGIHRLVRISPFDSQSRRHTSFASVFCYPEVDNSVNIKIEDKDIDIDDASQESLINKKGGQKIQLRNFTTTPIATDVKKVYIVGKGRSRRATFGAIAEEAGMLK